MLKVGFAGKNVIEIKTRDYPFSPVLVCDCCMTNHSKAQWFKAVNARTLSGSAAPTFCDPVDCSPPGSSVHVTS